MRVSTHAINLFAAAVATTLMSFVFDGGLKPASWLAGFVVVLASLYFSEIVTSKMSKSRG